MKPKKADFILFALPVVIALVCFWIFLPGEAGQTAVIRVDGETVQTIDLQTAKDQTIDLSLPYHNQIEIKDHAIRVTDADCPDRSCVKTGWIRSAGQTIACVPSKLTITITGDGGFDAIAGRKVW